MAYVRIHYFTFQYPPFAGPICSMMPLALRLARCFSTALAEMPIFSARAAALSLPSSDSKAKAALSAMAGAENECPICGRQMLGSRWFAQPGHRYMDLATCADHGKFLIRVRLSEQPDGTIRVSRLTYEATSEAAEAYARRAEKADPESAGRSTHRRRRRRSRLPQAEHSQDQE